jgi:hypothetical protein
VNANVMNFESNLGTSPSTLVKILVLAILDEA